MLSSLLLFLNGLMLLKLNLEEHIYVYVYSVTVTRNTFNLMFEKNTILKENVT